MGIISSRPKGEFKYCGPVDFPYDEKVPQFEKRNGLLFRLVNNAEKSWAFYSDSKKYEFHVTVVFGPNSSNLIPLGNTSISEGPNGCIVAKTIVYPRMTQPFIQGDVDGFTSTVNAVLLTRGFKECSNAENSDELESYTR
ncbi:hypothetical protein JKF63_05997 [Porcisia hertigi]|uniref:DUF1935 domain-containing protein n=1 Tax=Porcisia hertigi TaxID=2761500 RepID=A0A836LC52_9TRYP|nr:hypothetical protein JKF63_05997 [Porcisia hertigi]